MTGVAFWCIFMQLITLLSVYRKGVPILVRWNRPFNFILFAIYAAALGVDVIFFGSYRVFDLIAIFLQIGICYQFYLVGMAANNKKCN